MRGIALLTLLLASCAAPPPTSAPAPTGTVAPTAAATADPTEQPAATAQPTNAPAAPAPEPPAVKVIPEPFPVAASLQLRATNVDDALVANARWGVERYLTQLNGFRERGFTEPDQIGITGRFRDAVVAGLKGSATAGVVRQLAIEAMDVRRALAKPWGTVALAEVTATIVDRAVDGSAPEQREVGILRLVGQRLHVVDGWDHASGRWFNGTVPVDQTTIRAEIAQPLVNYLHMETWLPGSAVVQWRTDPSEGTPFGLARAERVAKIDRSKVLSRLFDPLTATVERYDTFTEVSSGLARVRVAGTVVTTDAGGTQRTPFERRVLVFMFGNWAPEVVDEKISAGVWASGGELALQKIDVSRA